MVHGVLFQLQRIHRFIRIRNATFRVFSKIRNVGRPLIVADVYGDQVVVIEKEKRPRGVRACLISTCL